MIHGRQNIILGLIYWHISRIEKARELFEQCGDIPDYPPFYMARGVLFQNTEREYCLSCQDFNQGCAGWIPTNGEHGTTSIIFCNQRDLMQLQLENAKQLLAVSRITRLSELTMPGHF